MYQSLCRVNGGNWSVTSGICVCSLNETGRTGPYCNTWSNDYTQPEVSLQNHKNGEHAKWVDDDGSVSPFKLLVLIILFFAGCILCYQVIRQRKQPDFLFDSKYAFDRKGLSLAKYDRVSVIDDELVGANDHAQDSEDSSDLESNDDGNEL
ncbi:hypothetical protein RFI_21674 [Reticulomyxa filosa]|uniref:Uncharacterized protein n=1 Tax=Reticulomyxa filosa TaxID=46433 RepID=X6MPU2_RETFI|nr:hypothetical protein RFI_21674 [Reticulomyxa filosa]|eukprot:ETO15696.1 hypothetical protein RFI_21674 [Reticulomyxa filosa]